MAEIERRQIRLSREPLAELQAGDLVEEVARRIAMPRDTLAEVKLAVVEACLNALEYGDGTVEVAVAAHNEGTEPWLEVEITDHGPGFDPGSVKDPVLEAKLRAARKRGWGLALIRRLMDEVEITSRPGLTRVRMIRRRGGM